MDMRIGSVRVIGTKETVETVVRHNHGGCIRDRGECPACDEFYAFHGAADILS